LPTLPSLFDAPTIATLAGETIFSTTVIGK
jgi:hypothetical protein